MTAIQKKIFIFLFFVLGFVTINTCCDQNFSIPLNRSSFPDDFLFGTASSSYQYEGASNEDGRGPSIWDTYTHKYPNKIQDHGNGDVAIDHYHRYKEDIGIMKDMGLDAYRFSISWSRILPNGTAAKGINIKGITFYNNLINELLLNGIKPFVTLFHWDLPQSLEDEYSGFLSNNIVNDFRDYVDICFNEFGDRVKHWITINEPWTYSTIGYSSGILAPGRCSNWMQLNCTGGDSATEPYLVAHNLILAHGVAVKLYREKYQKLQSGIIGISLASDWYLPKFEVAIDQNAVERALDFMLGWFLEPMTKGDYPSTMKSLVGNRLPKFSHEESKFVEGSLDFLGLNYYTSNYASNIDCIDVTKSSYSTDSHVNITTESNGIPIGPRAASSWINIYPKGIYELLHYTKRKYNISLIYITENGVDESNNATLTLKEALDDKMRIDYFYQHLYFLQRSIKDGINVKGYFAWSLLDNFEWNSGYSVRFGINYVDYNDGLKRYPKLSARWFKNFLMKKTNGTCHTSRNHLL